MSLLRSYSFGHVFGVDEIPEKVLTLFSDLIDNPGQQTQVASEIIDAALQGNINLNAPFNLKAYEFQVLNNNRLVKSHEAKKLVLIDYSNSADDDSNTGTINENVLSATQYGNIDRDDYDDLIHKDYLYHTASFIAECHNYFLVEYRLDFKVVLRQALRGIPESVDLLKSMCDDNKYISQFIYDLLNLKDDEIREEVYKMLM